MTFYLRVFALLLLLSMALGQPVPLYWQVDPGYTVPVDTANRFASQGVAPNNVSINTTESLVYKYTSSLTGIKGNITISGIPTIKVTTNSIVVNNTLLNMNFSYDAMSTDLVYVETGSIVSKEYKGIGNSSLANVTINYMKTLSISKGRAIYTVTDLKCELPKAIKVNEFYPEPKSDVNATLWKLAEGDLLKEINTTIQGTIKDKFDALVANESIASTFGDSTYNYTYGKTTITLNSSMTKVVLTGSSPSWSGNSIGYDMAVIGGSQRRSTFTPPGASRASYITLELVQNLFEYQTTSNDWTSMRVDSSMLVSDLFQFYLIDLESIVPSVFNKYPTLLAKLYAKCSISSDTWSIKIDTDLQRFVVGAEWDCSLLMQDGDVKLLSVKVPLSYQAQVTQVSTALKVYITSAVLNGEASWTEQPDLPIQNAKLANLYLKSLLGPLSGKLTLGTGFPCFTKSSSPRLNDNHIALVEGSKLATE